MNLRRVPWLSLAVGAGMPLGGLAFHALAQGVLVIPPCPLKSLTGWPCATCGMTRWAQALGRGDWAGAWHWHPVACLLLALVPLAVAWDLKRAWRGAAWPTLPDSTWARSAAWALLLGTWLLQAVRGI